MHIKSLSIENVRNITKAQLNCHEKVNIIVGLNGGGKTSLLESLYLLSTGKSFRTQQAQHYISNSAESCRVIAHLVTQVEDRKSQVLGWSQTRTNEAQCRMAGEICKKHSQIARILPVQVLSAMNYQLLKAGPAVRRKMLDWGVFHVKPDFQSQWQTLTQLLKQRNAALKAPLRYEELESWDVQIARVAQEVHSMREAFFQDWQIKFNESWGAFSRTNITLKYFKGWSDAQELHELLRLNYLRDKQLGYTQSGPHRADIRINVSDGQGREILSMGQQKLCSIVMNLTATEFVGKCTGKTIHYLIDDLAADLDRKARDKLINYILGLPSQLFITCMDLEELPAKSWHEIGLMFHVEHGSVATLESSELLDK